MSDPAVPTASMPALSPVLPEERVQILDVLRGFAVFGILVANMTHFKSASMYLALGSASEWAGTADRIAEYAITILVSGKFISLFSFLFGLGLAVQMSRAEAKGRSVVPVYVRRLLTLLLIGAVHAFLVWHGDILMSYALLGFPLLLLRNRSDRAMLLTATFFILLWPAVNTGRTVYRTLQDPEERARQAAATSAASEANRQQARAEYSEGTFLEIAIQRTRDVQYWYRWTVVIRVWGPCLALFLLGLYAGRRRILHDVSRHAALLSKVRWWGLGIGLLGEAVPFLPELFPELAQASYWSALRSICFTLGPPALSAFYVTTIALASRQEVWRQRLTPLSAVGRMALTNYLLQSVVCTLIFYSYGLGLYGTIGPAMGLLLSVGIYTLQIPFSVLWLRPFRFGPVEWLWRTLTYRRPMRMRAAFAAPVPALE